MKKRLCPLLLLALATLGTNQLSACEPHINTAKYGGFGDKGLGMYAPGPVAPMPTPSPAVYSSLAQHRRALAMQAAAYRAARRPMKLAKAYQLRQAKLAARESRRAWVLAKQDERRREAEQRELRPPAESSSPVLVAARTNIARPLDP